MVGLLRAAVAVAAFTLIGCHGPEKRPPIQAKVDDLQLPRGLRSTYESLIKALRTGNRNEIEAFTLRFSIKFTTGMRPTEHQDWGHDLNLPFVRTRFHDQIFRVREEKDGTVLIRTATSYLRFVETLHFGWKLFDYGDKPIQ